MKKIYCMLLLCSAVVCMTPVHALQSLQLQRAVDTEVVQRGRENRQSTLEWLLSGVKKTPLLTESQREVFIAVLTTDLESYTNQSNQQFFGDGLETDTSIRTIPLEKVLRGGPGKDGIPALIDPKFVSYDTAKNQGIIGNDSEGISVVSTDGSDARYYPFSILNWHEIVNDSLDDSSIMVTYCPLCGTAIVYDRNIGGEILKFKVSGKLYQSNLLMYDSKTESLWSQAFGEGKVGIYTDYELEYFPSQQLTAQQFHQKYPDGKVLSAETGYRRNYQIHSPYADYDTNDSLYFPVDEYSNQLPSKTLMVVINDKRGFSAAFDRKKLLEVGVASIRVNNNITVTAVVEEGGIIVVEDGHFIIPHFSEMRFSWSNRNQGSGLRWSGD